jgi:hypothetical protein
MLQIILRLKLALEWCLECVAAGLAELFWGGSQFVGTPLRACCLPHPGVVCVQRSECIGTDPT